MSTHIMVRGILRSIGEIRKVNTRNGETSVVDFGVVTDDRRQVDGEWQTIASVWTNFTAWGRIAENIVACLESGDDVMVSGYLTPKPPYTDKDGNERPARTHYTVEDIGLALTIFPREIIRDYKKGGSSAPKRNSAPARNSKPKVENKASDAGDADDMFDDLFDEEVL